MSEPNQNSRSEAFCDGVFAIALTLLIIDIKLPSTVEIDDTGPGNEQKKIIITIKNKI